MDYERTLTGRNTVRMVRTSAGVLPEVQPEVQPGVLQDSEDTNTAAAYCLNI